MASDLMSVTRSGLGGLGGAKAVLQRMGAAVSWQPVLIAAEGVGAPSQEGNPAPRVCARNWGKAVMFARSHCRWLFYESQRLDLCFLC